MLILLNDYLNFPEKYGKNVMAKYDNEYRRILRIGTADGHNIELTIYDPYFGERIIKTTRSLPVWVGKQANQL